MQMYKVETDDEIKFAIESGNFDMYVRDDENALWERKEGFDVDVFIDASSFGFMFMAVEKDEKEPLPKLINASVVPKVNISEIMDLEKDKEM